MEIEKFNQVFEELVGKCRELLVTKNVEYARGTDKLHNFKKAAQFAEGKHQIGALKGMMLKHTVSVYDMIDDELAGETHFLGKWEEKLIDHINYLVLLYAMLLERPMLYDTGFMDVAFAEQLRPGELKWVKEPYNGLY